MDSTLLINLCLVASSRGILSEFLVCCNLLIMCINITQYLKFKSHRIGLILIIKPIYILLIRKVSLNDFVTFIAVLLLTFTKKVT